MEKTLKELFDDAIFWISEQCSNGEEFARALVHIGMAREDIEMTIINLDAIEDEYDAQNIKAYLDECF